MNRTTKTFCAALCALAATGGTASAQSYNCAPRDDVVGRLSEQFGEARQSIGMTSGNRVVEMYASPDTGTWTITMTLPTGITCIIGAGQAWERLDEEATPAGQPI